MATENFKQFVKDVYDITDAKEDDYVSFAVLAERETGDIAILQNVSNVCIHDLGDMLKVACELFLRRASGRMNGNQAAHLFASICNEVLSEWEPDMNKRILKQIFQLNDDSNPFSYQDEIEMNCD